jgi:hypothetical protein
MSDRPILFNDLMKVAGYDPAEWAGEDVTERRPAVPRIALKAQTAEEELETAAEKIVEETGLSIQQARVRALRANADLKKRVYAEAQAKANLARPQTQKCPEAPAAPTGPAIDAVETAAKRLVAEGSGLSIQQARQRVLAKDRELKRRWYQDHRQG